MRVALLPQLRLATTTSCPAGPSQMMAAAHLPRCIARLVWRMRYAQWTALVLSISEHNIALSVGVVQVWRLDLMPLHQPIALMFALAMLLRFVGAGVAFLFTNINHQIPRRPRQLLPPPRPQPHPPHLQALLPRHPRALPPHLQALPHHLQVLPRHL